MIDPERWQRLQQVFDGAVVLAADERAAYLDRECGDDDDLRRRAESLLAASALASAKLGRVVGSAARALAADLAPGQRVGPWELIREIGRGGMGAVFLARRADGEYAAEAAIKMIGGMRTAEHLWRFRSERQILSDLDHPNIARMLGGGTTDGGVPWVAMEFVDGVPLDRYCDAHGLSIDQRLSLFLNICDAVRYAHQRLVVHRDLKPGNMLVTRDGTAKLLDFGIAKLLAPGSAGMRSTAPGVRLMTPAYASPEQIRGEPITVATDVYGLGVVLYQLLAGRLPHDIAGKSLREIEDLICGAIPPKASEVAPPETAKRLTGDLDTIVAMAIRVDPARRYESVEALAEDIRRHRSALPVRARGDAVSYRLGRFLRRHRVGSAVGATSVALAGAFVAALSVQAKRLATERDAATLARANADQVVSFLTSVFEVSNPSESRGRTVTARELLDAGARRVNTELAAQPALQASMMGVIGNVYGTLALNDQARPLLEQALARSRALFGDRSDEVATSALSLAVLDQDIGDVKAAEPLMRQALATRRALHGAKDARVTEAMSDLAYLLQTNGKDAEAEPLLREALATNRQLYPPGDPRIASSMTRLARLLRADGKLDEAIALLREALVAQRKAYGNTHPDVASTIRNLASALRDKGSLDEADTLYQEAIALRRAVLGDTNPEVANTLNSYALLLDRKGETARAVEVYREVIRVWEQIYKGPHPDLAAAYNNIASSLRTERHYDESAEFYAKSRRVQDQVLPPGHPNRAMPMIGLASVYMDEKRFARAETLYREALALRRKALPPGHRYIGETLSDLGACLTAERRFSEADSVLAEAVKVLDAAEGPDAARTKRARARIAELQRERARTAQAGRPVPISDQ